MIIITMKTTWLNLLNHQEFREYDKQSLLNDIAGGIWSSITDGSAVIDPLTLFKFVMLSFADLKSYKFYYWCGFPAFVPLAPYLLVPEVTPHMSSYTHNSVSQWPSVDIYRAVKSHENFISLASAMVFAVHLDPSVNKYSNHAHRWDISHCEH